MRILIVEDEQTLREQLETRLRAEGYAVDAAGTGEEGEFFGHEYPIDAAIVDLGLPDKPGGELIKSWRGSGRSISWASAWIQCWSPSCQT